MSENYWYSSLSGQEIEDTLLGAVRGDIDQNQTTSWKARARANIGAGESNSTFKILGYFDTLEDLQEWLQQLPQSGDAYGIGTESPYDVYVYDGIHNTWVNNGPISYSDALIDDNDISLERTWSSTKINTEVGAVRTLANAAQSAADAAQTTADGKAPTNHASTATTYGVGNGTNYGHVKLSDTPDANQDVGDGVAATPAAVQSAYDAAIAFEDITSAFTPTSGVKLQALKIGNMVVARATGERTGATTAWVLANIPTQYRPSDSIWVGAAYLNEYKTGVCSVAGGQLLIPVLTFSTSWCYVEITWILGTPSI